MIFTVTIIESNKTENKLKYVIIRDNIKGGYELPMTPREIIKLLKENGYETISQNGSHIKMKNVHTGKSVIVPYHSKDLKKGLEQAILRQAGIR